MVLHRSLRYRAGTQSGGPLGRRSVPLAGVAFLGRNLYPGLNTPRRNRNYAAAAVPSSASASGFGPLSSPFAPGSRSTSSITAMLAASP